MPLSKYRNFKTRICRPVGLTDAEKKQVICFAAARIGRKYDTRHVFDLARYLCPTPPVPVRWRRRMIALGSGDPTRTICSTLIAQAFHSVPYPILPRTNAYPSSNASRAHTPAMKSCTYVITACSPHVTSICRRIFRSSSRLSGPPSILTS